MSTSHNSVLSTRGLGQHESKGIRCVLPDLITEVVHYSEESDNVALSGPATALSIGVSTPRAYWFPQIQMWSHSFAM